MSDKSLDVAIVGGGPAGSACALSLLERGIRPIIIEEQRFPRYRIGESLTGGVGEVLRGLGMDPWLEAEGAPVKYGVKVFGNRRSFWVPVMGRKPEGELVPATTWQVRRSRFDEALLTAALERGAEYRSGRAMNPLVEDGRVEGVVVRNPEGREEPLRATFVVDASGPAAFLSQRGVASPKLRGRYDNQVAIFSQVRGALTGVDTEPGNTLIFYRQLNHWGWFIPLDKEVVSVGVVVPATYFRERGLSKEEFLRSELSTINAELDMRVPDRAFVEEVRAASNYSYRVRDFVGPGFLCIGDSHRFIDPIFSFGVHFALHEAAMAADAIERELSASQGHGESPTAEFQRLAERGQDVIQNMIDCFWLEPFAFAGLVHHSNREEMIDLFAGRVYGEDVDEMEAVKHMRSILSKKRGSAPDEPAPVPVRGS